MGPALRVGQAKRFWGTHVRHFALDTALGGGGDSDGSGDSGGSGGSEGSGDSGGGGGGGGGDGASAGGSQVGRKTRVSIDFRCCVREHFDADWHVPGVVYQHERRSMRFTRRRRGGGGDGGGDGDDSGDGKGGGERGAMRWVGCHD